MTELAGQDKRWRDLFVARAGGDSLSSDDLAFLRSHTAEAAEVRAEQAAYAAIEGLGTTGEVDDDMIGRAVTQHVGDEGTVVNVAPARWSRGTWIGAGVGLAAAASLVLWVGGQRPQNEAVADADATAPSMQAQPDDPPPEGFLVLEGSLAEASDTGIPLDTELHVTSPRACVGQIGGARVCLSDGTSFSGKSNGSGTVQVHAGRAEVDVPSDIRVSRFHVEVAGDEFVAAAGTRFVVETSEVSRWEVQVLEGTVTVTTANGETRKLASGEQLSGEPAPEEPTEADQRRKPAPSLADLRAQARTARGEGRIAEATRAYEHLVKAYPGTPAAQTALVTLAQLYLDRSKPRAALRAYERYLASGGSLAEEASYGRIQSLQRLGREAEEHEAIEQFLAKYPRSSYAASLRQRLP